MSKQNLSPYDRDMLAMVNSFTKTECTISFAKEFIVVTIDTQKVDKNNFKALESAIKGRLGERFISINEVDYVLANSEFVYQLRFEYDPIDYPEEYRFELTKPKEVPGTLFVTSLKEVHAVCFTRDNFNKVKDFTGGGTLTLNSNINQDEKQNIYEFPTESGVLLKVLEGDYIVKDSFNRFSVIGKSEFERYFEPNDEL